MQTAVMTVPAQAGSGIIWGLDSVRFGPAPFDRGEAGELRRHGWSWRI